MRFEWKKWIAFLDRYGLRGDAKFTDGKIYHSAIFDDHDDDAGTYGNDAFTFMSAKYVRENAHPQIQQLTVAMSHHD